MAEHPHFSFPNITTDMAIIGFTGAIGSGCTYLAEGLRDHHGYVYCRLSDPIRKWAQESGIPETVKNMQDAGNEFRRRYGNGVLAGAALSDVSDRLPAPGSKGRPIGVVLDGIRNLGEIEALQQLPNFFLISVQAETKKRMARTIGDGSKFSTEEEFQEADKRDREEDVAYGQQVQKCNDLADIIVINEEYVGPRAAKPYRQYINRLLHKDYIALIEHVAGGRLPNERRAKPDEVLMTAAYVESKRSSCLKRKVGAVIASPDGDIIAAGHNEVPKASEPCIEDPRYGWCYRDLTQEKIGREIKHCPACGRAIRVKGKCRKCGKKFTQFSKRCPDKNCQFSVDVEYECPKCGRAVFTDFLPGRGPATGKLLDLCRALHAEENAILNLSRLGIRLPEPGKSMHEGNGPMTGCVLYSTTFPCNLCANKIASVGIKKVVYAEPYEMDEATRTFEKQGIVMQRFQGVKSRAFFRLYA